MKFILLLLIQLMLTQNMEAKEQCTMKTDDTDISTDAEKLTTYGLPSIHTLWKKIKEVGNFAQDTIKDIGDKAIKKLYALMIGLRNSILALINLLVTQLENVKNEVYIAILTAWEIAGDIKHVMKDKDFIRALIKKIINRVTTCIIKKVKKSIVSACESKKSCSGKERDTINKSEMMKGAIDKINKCVEVENDEDEEVANVVHVIMKMATMKSTIRDLTSNVMEILLQCTSEGILDASAAIADEVQNIYNSVMDKRAKSVASKIEL